MTRILPIYADSCLSEKYFDRQLCHSDKGGISEKILNSKKALLEYYVELSLNVYMLSPLLLFLLGFA